jgi:hypothetical protein
MSFLLLRGVPGQAILLQRLDARRSTEVARYSKA